LNVLYVINMQDAALDAVLGVYSKFHYKIKH